ncbi:MAG TPA: GNAT family N-acetyltransferase [Steroidobacteraceae bacterium]
MTTADIQYHTDRSVGVAEFKDILERSGLAARRPVGDTKRLERMLRAYNLILTAWDGELLVGIATCWTDYAYSAYLADLAVAADHQHSGIGRELVYLARQTMGPQVTLILLSAPAAVEYYPKIGMERFTDCFIFRRSQ